MTSDPWVLFGCCIVLSCLCSTFLVFCLLHSRGVRGLREQHRNLLELEADHAALVRRLKRFQTTFAGEASAESKRTVSKATRDFVQQMQFRGMGEDNQPDQNVMGQ